MLEFKFNTGTDVMNSTLIDASIEGMQSINYQVIAEMMRADVLDHFRQEEGPVGGWKSLKFRDGKPLQDTGRLRGSINPEYTDKEAIVGIGSGLDYAKIHNYGGNAGRNNKVKIPQRQFAWLSEKAIERIIKYIIRKATGQAAKGE